ncbi:hypothetical protein B4N89_43980 [Embleya scabrispora]|uniref:Uncharacterized protein n=1 Tax=Embleya scabrispora TaxID=159449 RepID=A0A1T3NLB8_9ACTN|nr:hypothetical protein [Embleya scabrispora]OPC77465.1 hypothetical protein B4N89_43980 [Embleya scabrispora]
MTGPSPVPAWPVVRIELSTDGRVRVDGTEVPVPPGVDPRAAALEAAAATARLLRRPVRATAVEPDGTVFPLIVAENGEVAAANDPAAPPHKRRSRPGRRKRGPDATTAPAPRFGEPSGPTTALGAPEAPMRGTSRPSASVDAPGPTVEQARSVAEIARLLRAGDGERAMTLAAALDAAVEAGDDRRAVPAAREVHAYVALMTDRPGLAVQLYADAALARVDRPEETARMARNAHYSWLRVAEPESAYGLGSVVLRAYEAVPDDPGCEAVRDRMRSLRSRPSDA